jgi:uncharacterized protein
MSGAANRNREKDDTPLDAFFTNMSPLAAASLYLGLMVLLMMGLKMWTGAQRGRLKVQPGDSSNAEFNRMLRVQHNAVEDVPPLMVGLLALGLLEAPLWMIHTAGGVLVVSRLLHAVGLAGSGAFSFGRLVGTVGTLLCYLTIGVGLIVIAVMWAT